MRRRILFTATIIQYGDWEIRLSVDKTSIPNTGGEVIISSTASRTVYWSNGTTSIETASPNINTSYGVINGNTLIVDENDSTSIRTIIITATYEQASKTIEVEQSVKTISQYGNWIVQVNANPTVISAAGGTSVVSCEAIRTITWSDGSITTQTATPALDSDFGTFSNNILSIPANKTEQDILITITASHEGAEAQCTVKQNKDTISSYGDVNLTVGTVANIPAKGGSVTSTGSNATQVINWVSGRTTTVYPSVTEGTLSNVSSKNTSISNRTKVGNITITATGQGNKTSSKQIDVYQEGNYVTQVDAVLANTDKTTHFYYDGTVSAAAGTKSPTLNGKAYLKFSSGADRYASSSDVPNGISLNFSRTFVESTNSGHANATVNSSGTVTWEANTGTATRSVTVDSTLTVTVTHSSDYSAGGTIKGTLSQSAVCTQNADSISTYSYANPIVTLSYSTQASNAANSTQSPTLSYSQVRTNHYVSGKTTTTSITSGATSIVYAESTAHANASVNTSSGVVTWSSANQNTSTTRSVGVTVKVTLNGKEGSATATATQKADTITNGSWTGTLTASKSTLGAGADSATITYGKVYRTRKWTSGGGDAGNEYYNGTIYVTVSESSNYLSGGTGNAANSSSSNSTCTLSKSTYGTTAVSAETATLYLRINSTTGTSVKSIKITTTANVAGGGGTKGGAVTYGDITKGEITNATVPASGGEKTATAGNGSQTKSTATVYYLWTSGSQGDVKTAAKTETISVTPSPASLTKSGSNLGTTEKAKTTLGSTTVTWSANGKSATGTMYVYQQANSKSSTAEYDYGSWGGGAISFNSTSALSAGADSRTITIKPWSRTKTPKYKWTSGSYSYGTATTEYYTSSVTVSEDGAYTSLDATSYTASSSNKTLTLTKSTCGTTSTSTATITITAKGATTTTATITQTANVKDATFTYGSITIEAYSYAVFDGGATTKDPTLSYSQTKTGKWTSGSTSSTTTISSGATLSYSMITTSIFTSIVGSSGRITSAQRSEIGPEHTTTATVKVTLNGKSATKSATVTSAENVYVITQVNSVSNSARYTSYPVALNYFMGKTAGDTCQLSGFLTVIARHEMSNGSSSSSGQDCVPITDLESYGLTLSILSGSLKNYANVTNAGLVTLSRNFSSSASSGTTVFAISYNGSVLCQLSVKMTFLSSRTKGTQTINWTINGDYSDAVAGYYYGDIYRFRLCFLLYMTSSSDDWESTVYGMPYVMHIKTNDAGLKSGTLTVPFTMQSTNTYVYAKMALVSPSGMGVLLTPNSSSVGGGRVMLSPSFTGSQDVGFSYS